MFGHRNYKKLFEFSIIFLKMDPSNLLPKMASDSPGPTRFRLGSSRTSPYLKVNVEAIKAEQNPDTIRSLAISTSHVKYITPGQCDILKQNGYVSQGKKFSKKRHQFVSK